MNLYNFTTKKNFNSSFYLLTVYFCLLILAAVYLANFDSYLLSGHNQLFILHMSTDICLVNVHLADSNRGLSGQFWQSCNWPILTAIYGLFWQLFTWPIMTAIYLAYFDSYLPGRFWQTFTWTILTDVYLTDFHSYLPGRFWQSFTWPILTPIYLADSNSRLPGRFLQTFTRPILTAIYLAGYDSRLPGLLWQLLLLLRTLQLNC